MKKYLLVVLGALIFVGCTATKTIPLQSASTTYKVGDMYNQNGVKGVVVQVDASGKHGLLMSLESSNAKWTSDKRFDFETNAFSEDDGQKNMSAIAKYVESGKASWTDFPLMNWARSLGDGWYIPSKQEALAIMKNMNNGSDAYKWNVNMSYLFFIRVHPKNDFEKFDHMQRQYGGDKLVDDNGFSGTFAPYRMMTSTEGEGGMVYGVQFDMNNVKGAITQGLPGTTSKFAASLMQKRPPLMVGIKSRAVRKF
ncbi:MAG: hypothetical protein K6A67_00460 [Bacteroidales bacterium]|nr:hypothetical protein [Bacteroidales bacterium]